MRVLKLTLEYDGTDFVGWQRQANGTSVQELLEAALSRFEGGPVTVHGAGRTDAGVHALGQVASVSLATPHSVDALRRGLNRQLPRSIRVLAVEEALPQFHARYGASGKVYEYRIAISPVMSPFQARYAWHIPQPLDLPAMRAASGYLVGTHDFAAFQGSGGIIRHTVRRVDRIECQEPDGHSRLLTIIIGADGFLRHMVRNIVGTLVDVGLGRRDSGDIAGILAGLDRRAAGPTAPARGLFLVRVLY